MQPSEPIRPSPHAPLPPATAAGPGPWAALGTVALYFVLQLGIAAVIAALFTLAAALRSGSPAGLHMDPGAIARSLPANPDLRVLVTVLAIAIAAGLMVLIVRRLWPACWRLADPPGFGVVAPRSRRDLWLACALGVVMVVLGGGLTQLLAGSQEVNQDVAMVAARVSWPMQLLLAVLVVCVAPFIEELVFRGVLLSGLASRVGVRWAVVGTALVFGCAHLPDFAFAWYPLPALVLLGIVLGWLRLRSGSLWPAVAMHATNNLMAVIGWLVTTRAGH